jgi:serine/threonine protein kinase/WD40 repeat protein/Tfp pilus assembly protein PilF
MTERSVDASVLDPLDIVAEEFIRRLRAGDHPSLSEYAARHPELAERIKALFPALVEMEAAGSAVGPLAGTPQRAPRVPVRIGEFRILRTVGEGGMGVVFEAVQESLGRHVALKVLARGRGATYLERFRREARAVARLHHTNVVPVFAVGEAEGVHYYAMQFIHGQSLDAVLREVRALRRPGAGSPLEAAASSLAATVARSLQDGDFAAPAPEARVPQAPTHPAARSELPNQSEGVYYREAARLGTQAAEALAYAHGQGVLHRDVKPSNLLLDTQGTLWITDFGLAKADDSDDLTQTGDVVGTLRYMAPERFSGRADARSDVYALGATLYELVTLRPAFPHSDRLELLERITREVPPAPRRFEPRIPRDLETIVQKAMARDPIDRYRSAADLAADLHRFLSDRPILARRASPVEELWRWARRNRMVAGLAASIALLLVFAAVGAALAAFQMGRDRDHARRAERERTRQLAHSLLDQARAARFSRRPGQRFDGLDAIRKASLLGRQMGEPASFFDELRTQAVACMALPDVRIGTGANAPSALPYGFIAAAEDRYVAFDGSGQLRVVRMDDDCEINRLEVYPGSSTVRLSADGSVIAACSTSGSFRAWDLRRSDPAPLMDESTGIRRYDVRSDGAELVLGRDDGTIELRAVRSGRAPRQLPIRGVLAELAYAPDGRWLAVSVDRTVTIVDCQKASVAVNLPQIAPITSMSWTADGQRLAVTPGNGLVVLWDVPAGLEIRRFATRDDGGTILAFAPRGEILLSTGWSGMVRFCDPKSGQLCLSFDSSPSVAWNRDGRLIAAAARHHVGALELATGREYQSAEVTAQRELSVGSIAVHPRGRLLAAAVQQLALFWDLKTGRKIGSLPESCYNLAFDAAGDLIVHGRSGLSRRPITADADESLIVGPPARIEGPEPDGIMAIASSRDGRVVAGTFAEGPAVLHCERPERPVWLGRQGDVRLLTVSPDGRFVAASSWNRGEGTRIYDAATGQPVARLPSLNSLITAFSPDGRLFLGDSSGSKLHVVRTGTWSTVTELPSALAASFSGDGRLLALAGSDGAVRLVVPESGRELARLEPPEPDRVYGMAFAPDGSRLAVVYSLQRTIGVWNLGLIRPQLAELGLDWESSPLPVEKEPERPLSVRVVGAAQAKPDVEILAGLASHGAGNRRDLADAEAHYRLGLDCVRRGAWASALSQFDRAGALRPGHAPAHFQRGLIQANVRHNFSAAAADFGRAVALEPDFVEARLNRARCRAKAGRWSEAIADADFVLARQPWNLDARVFRGRAYALSGKHREALADFNEGASLYPHYASLFEMRSASLKALGDERGSAAVMGRCREMISALQANNDAWRLATGPALKRDPEVALALARFAALASPQVAEHHNTLGVALYRLGRYREAQDQFRASIHYGTGQFESYDLYFLALCHRRLGEPFVAWVEFFRAIASQARNQSRLTAAQRIELTSFCAEAFSGLIRPIPSP